MPVCGHLGGTLGAAHPRARGDHPQRASRSCADAHPARLRARLSRPGRGLPPFAEALDDVEGFSHLHLIYWLHRAGEIANSVAGSSPLKVVPYLDDVPRGVFATRTPVRPNPIGLSLVRLVERHGDVLLVEDLDVLDGTPLLDIKPYVEKFDLRTGTRAGWFEGGREEVPESR